MVPETLSLKWASVPRPVNNPKLRLICFPPAGSGTVIYQKWVASFPSDVEVWIVRLPGRETRLRDPLFYDMSSLVESLADTLNPYLDIPYILFGHSLGSLICFELTRYLRRFNKPLPLHLLLSGHRAPHRPPLNPPIHQASDEEFLARIKDMGGTPDAFFEMKDLVELMLPALRADFTIWETYQYREEYPLDIPMTVFGSDGDGDAAEADFYAWEQHTTKPFEIHMFHGNHFYFQDDPTALLELINGSLQSYLLG